MKDVLIRNVKSDLDDMFDYDRDGLLDLQEQWEQANFIGNEDSDDEEDSEEWDSTDLDEDKDLDSCSWDSDGDSDNW